MTTLHNPRISMICALSQNRVIGKGDRIPWHIKQDLMRFKHKTIGHTVIMGRATFESVMGYYKRSGRPVPDRRHIIITRDPSYDPGHPGCFRVGSVEEALQKAREIEAEEVFVSGGAQVFEQFMPHAARLYLTVVEGTFDGDKFFPDYSAFTKVINREGKEENGITFTFLDLEKAARTKKMRKTVFISLMQPPRFHGDLLI